MSVIRIMQNNWHRYLVRINYILLMLIVTVASIFLAVFFTAKLEIKGNIALVAADDALLHNASAFHVTVMPQEPKLSDLMLNRYDAVVIDRGNGSFDIHSLKSPDLQQKLRQAILHPDVPLADADHRGVGTNILGYLIFGVLLQGLLFMMLYCDDKESGVFRRISTTPVGLGAYLLAHGITNYLLVMAPTMAVLALAREVFHLDIGFTYLQYAGLLGLLAMLSTAFALFMSSVMQKADNCNTMGSSIITLSTILAGSFYSFSSNRPIFDAVISVLPQKCFLTLVQGVERGTGLAGHWVQLAGLLVLPVVLFVLSVLAARRNLRGA